MASANAVSIVRELGIRESGQPGSLAFLGPRDHAAPYHSSCAKTGHHKANRLAYFSPYLFDAASIYRCRAEDHARATAPFDDSCDSRHIHAGSHNGKAKCAGGSCRALVPRKNAGDVSSAWKNSISCTSLLSGYKPNRISWLELSSNSDWESNASNTCKMGTFSRLVMLKICRIW